MIPEDKYECVWIEVKKIESEHVEVFHKQEIHFRKSFDIYHFIASLSFTTKSDAEDVIISLPELEYQFAKCENTILAAKNQETSTMVKVILEPGRLVLDGFGSMAGARYDVNLQFFLRTTGCDES